MEVGEKDLKKKDRKRIILATTPDGKVIKINAKSTKHKYTGADIAFYIADYLFFIIFTISCIFPFYYIFINTISDAKLVNSGSINFIPRGLNIQNYIQLKNVSDLGNAVMISVLRTVIGTALMVLASAFVGYLMTKN